MTITEQSWLNYIQGLRIVSDTAASQMAAFLAQIDDPATPAARKALIDYAYALTNKYGDAAAALACEMYDSVAELSDVVVPAAEPAEPADIHEVAKAVNGTIKTRNPEIISGAVGRLVKLQGVDTTMYNAIRDGAQWAWIPHGDTCAFCIALGSRGWQRASESALKGGHAEHIHSHCDCTYAVRFNDDTDVQGYDPGEYLKMYESADGTNSKEKINSMRREFYKENNDEIKEQKRSAYAKRKERESSRAEEKVV